ncbi:MAG: CaiB/BaiF CoA transferase family protein, partial [Trebonia sp.]
MTGPEQGWLEGVKVVEFAQVVAGPLAGGLLADHGATVVHVESPGEGDSARTMGPDKDGVHLWWKVSGRNKRSVTINLRDPRGQDLAQQLVRWADVVVTGLRAGTLRRWRINWESLHAVNPRLVMLQISGYGANTSLAGAPGLGKVGEAQSGVVYLTGDEDGRPLHTGFSHGDAVTGLMGSFAITAALHRRAVYPGFDGEW